MKALHTYTTISRQSKRKAGADDTLDVNKKIKQNIKKAVKKRENTIQASQVSRKKNESTRRVT